MNLNRSDSHTALKEQSAVGTTTMSNDKVNGDSELQQQQQQQQQSFLSSSSSSAAPAAADGQPRSLDVGDVLGLDFAPQAQTLGVGMKLSNNDDDLTSEQRPEKKSKLDAGEAGGGRVTRGDDVSFDPFSTRQIAEDQKSSPAAAAAQQQITTNMPNMMFPNMMTGTSTNPTAAAEGTLQPSSFSGFLQDGNSSGGQMQSIPGTDGTSSFQQLLMQNQALISVAAAQQQSSMQFNQTTGGNIVRPTNSTASKPIGTGMMGQQQIQLMQMQGNPFFAPMGNHQAFQNQLAAYQAGLMSLPPQFFQPQASNLMVLPGFLPPIAGFSGGGGMGSMSSFQGSSLQGAMNPTRIATSNPQQPQPPLSAEDAAKLSGRQPQSLYMPCDHDSLSEYQCLVRKQIEIFEARPEDVESNAKGRNKPIVLGQVGLRCRHCRALPPKSRQRGATYYPAKLNGLYQAAQSMASGHLCYHCEHIPIDLRQELLVLRERKSSAGGGKKYWGDGVRILGVEEDESGLRFQQKKA
jgi:hypothetical protein